MTATEEERAQQEENPLLEGLQVRATPDPCVLVIFGASGDLTTKKLFPALYSLDLRLDASDRREAVRARPRVGPRAQHGRPEALRGGRGIPDRPLPGQGDGPEHARTAVLERHLRADLEPAVHQPRADHRRGDDRDRGPGRLLRAGGRDPRHLPEPPAPAARADGDGAPDRLHVRVGAEREGEGAPLAAHAGPEVGRARPVRTRVHRGRGGGRLPRGEGGGAGLDDGAVRGGEALRRHRALGGHAVLRAHGQAARAARDDDRDRVQARAAPAVRGGRRRGPAPERPAHPHPAGRGRLARDRREGAGPGDDDPDGPHGLPLRRRVPDGHARGVRAADPRRDARRRDALHAHGRGRGAVGARGRDRRAVAARSAGLPELRGRLLGSALGGRADPAGRQVVAAALTSVTAIEDELASLRVDTETGAVFQRTSVLTHIAWVPEEWVAAAEDVLTGLAERHPSRTIVLVPEPDGDAELDGGVEVECYPVGDGRSVCVETIRIRLGGRRAEAPASVVQPLLIPDLPVFLRWRGLPTYGAHHFEQLVDVVDRLIVDSTEWPGLPAPYAQLAELFDRVAVSDIAWARTSRWRPQLASLWPGIADVKRVRVSGTAPQAHLLAGWLRSRLGRKIELEHEPSDRLGGGGEDEEAVRGASRVIGRTST